MCSVICVETPERDCEGICLSTTIDNGAFQICGPNQQQLVLKRASPGGSDGKESACNAGDPGSMPPGEENEATTPVFWPGESHGLGSLAGYSPWGHKELDTTEQLNTSTSQCSTSRDRGG